MKQKNKPFFAYRSFGKEFDARSRFARIGVDQFAVFFEKPETALFRLIPDDNCREIV